MSTKDTTLSLLSLPKAEVICALCNRLEEAALSKSFGAQIMHDKPCCRRQNSSLVFALLGSGLALVPFLLGSNSYLLEWKYLFCA